MSHKQRLLHELLQEDQEPFRLKTHIADRRSQLKKPSPPATLRLDKRRPDPATRRGVLCFLSLQNSPLFDFPSPAKSPRNPAVFLHVPSKTAAHLVEAAMRIQKHQRARARPGPKRLGLGLLTSLLKKLSKTKSRAIENPTTPENEKACDRRESSANWTETNEDESLDFEPSTSSYLSDCSDGDAAFRFNLLRTPPTSGRRTPEFRSPATSPRRVNQEKENYQSNNSDNVREEEDKEQCSPVSILDAPFDDDCNLQSSYENVERAKHQLLQRLRRFEEPETVEPILTRVLNHSRTMSSDMKKLVSDLIVEERSKIVGSCDDEVVESRICKRLDSWGEVELNTIDMMIGFDLKREFDGWTRFSQQAEDLPSEIEVAIYGLLVEELSVELLFMNTRHE